MLKIHFLNVGHGDCIILENFDTNRTTMIDINSSSTFDDATKDELILEALELINDQIFKSAYQMALYDDTQLLEKAGYDIKVQDPLEYMRINDIGTIFRFISTHPHMDHLSGLSSLMSNKSIINFWILKNKFEQDNSKLSTSQKADWKSYTSIRDHNEHELNGYYIVRPQEGDELDFWKEDGIKILAPNPELLKLSTDKDKPNIMSYVLLVQYGKCKIVFGGDAEEETWKYLYETYPEELKDISILKASHHGRDSGYYQPAVKHMNPVATIVSVGKKPKTDASKKYTQYCNNVFSTRWKGNIVFTCNIDGKMTYDIQYDR